MVTDDNNNDQLMRDARRWFDQSQFVKEAKKQRERRFNARENKRRRRCQAVRPLNDAELRKRAIFGDRAIATRPKHARLLSLINGQIALTREERALAQFAIDKRLRKWLDQNLGFEPGASTLSAANKDLRAEASFLMARKFRRFFRKNAHRLNFFFVTIIHDGWRTTDRDTHVDLKDIKTRARNLLHPLGLNYLGVVELDAVTNYPAGGQGICIMPHLHMIAWTEQDLTANDLQGQLLESSRLTSDWDAPTVVCSQLTDEEIVHKAYYMFEQPFKAKRLGRVNSVTGKRKLHTVQSWVPPHLTLRLSEILAHCTLKDLVMSSGEGVAFKGSLLNGLRKHQRKAGLPKRPTCMTAKEAFRQLRATTKRGIIRGEVTIRR